MISESGSSATVGSRYDADAAMPVLGLERNAWDDHGLPSTVAFTAAYGAATMDVARSGPPRCRRPRRRHRGGHDRSGHHRRDRRRDRRQLHDRRGPPRRGAVLVEHGRLRLRPRGDAGRHLDRARPSGRPRAQRRRRRRVDRRRVGAVRQPRAVDRRGRLRPRRRRQPRRLRRRPQPRLRRRRRHRPGSPASTAATPTGATYAGSGQYEPPPSPATRSPTPSSGSPPSPTRPPPSATAATPTGRC